MEFPIRRVGPFQKVKRHTERRGKGPTAKRRAAKRRKLDAVELAHMREARDRDRYCRFPVCGCQQQWQAGPYQAEVSHATHRGMAGDPTGERSHPSRLLLLCNWRHKLSKFSIDRKGIRWVPLTDAGANGPIQWELAGAHLPMPIFLERYPGLELRPDVGEWFVLATETAPHEYAPLTEAQAAILTWLAGMDV